MPERTQPFSWSVSRDASFRYCARQYWWSYYGSRGGWRTDAPPEVRDAYVLKKLSTRWTWVGTAVHQAIEAILRAMRARAEDGMLPFSDPAVQVEAELDRLTERMRSDWRASRRESWKRDPGRGFGLAEHAYGERLSPDEWKGVHDRARGALRAFLTSDLFSDLVQSDPATWLSIEELQQFDFEGTPVWFVMDFARRRGDGSIDIYDWKTGVANEGANRPQLGFYTLFVQSQHGLPASKIHNHLVYLGEGINVVAFTLKDDDLDAARTFLRESIATLRSRLSDAEANLAIREDFPLTDNLSQCVPCVFRRLCGR